MLTTIDEIIEDAEYAGSIRKTPARVLYHVTDLDRLDTVTFSTEQDAYDHWLECQHHAAYSVNLAEGSVYPLDLDFADRLEGETNAARSDRRHEASFKAGRM